MPEKAPVATHAERGLVGHPGSCRAGPSQGTGGALCQKLAGDKGRRRLGLAGPDAGNGRAVSTEGSVSTRLRLGGALWGE